MSDAVLEAMIAAYEAQPYDEDRREAMRAALRAAEAAGWKLVREEVTPAMLTAGRDAYMRGTSPTQADVYLAMLAAAPSLTGEPQ